MLHKFNLVKGIWTASWLSLSPQNPFQSSIILFSSHSDIFFSPLHRDLRQLITTLQPRRTTPSWCLTMRAVAPRLDPWAPSTPPAAEGTKITITSTTGAHASGNLQTCTAEVTTKIFLCLSLSLGCWRWEQSSANRGRKFYCFYFFVVVVSFSSRRMRTASDNWFPPTLTEWQWKRFKIVKKVLKSMKHKSHKNSPRLIVVVYAYICLLKA